MLSSISKIASVFPPPHFLAAPAAGLDISVGALRFAELARSGTHLRLARSGEMKIPDGVFAGGEIKNRDALKALLSDFQKKHKIRFVHASVPEQPSFILYLELPRVPRNEIRKNLLERILQHVPFSSSDIVFDYEDTPCGAADAGDTHCLGVTILPQKIAADYISLLAECGMEPLSLELGAQALSRALLPKKNDGACPHTLPLVVREDSAKRNERKGVGACMLVDIDRDHTGIAIVDANVVRFTATITMGGSMLTDAAAKKLALSPEEAEKIKRAVGLKKIKDGLDMAGILIPPLSTLRDEIKRYFLYWHTHVVTKEAVTVPRIQKIFLCGEEADVPGLADYLRGSLKETVVIANPWRNINPLTEYTPSMSRTHALRFGTAFGLALRAFS